MSEECLREKVAYLRSRIIGMYRALYEGQDLRRRAADAMYSTDGMPGSTKKLTIRQVKDGVVTEYDLYVHVAHFDGMLNFINITCHGSLDYSVRRLITMVCTYARRELRHGLLTEEQLIRDWRGTVDGTNSFEPQGSCEQLPGGYMDKLVASPLDAVARWMETRGKDVSGTK